MIWYFLAFLLLLIALGLLIVTRIRDQRYLRRKTSEVIRPEIREELELEEEAVRTRQQKFRDALKQAQKSDE